MIYQGQSLKLEYDLDANDRQVIVGAWVTGPSGVTTELNLDDDGVADAVWQIDSQDSLNTYLKGK